MLLRPQTLDRPRRVDPAVHRAQEEPSRGDSREPGFRAGDPALFKEAMRLLEGAAFYVDEAREEYLRIVAFDEVNASNMVRISGPTQAIKMNIAIQHEFARIGCPTPFDGAKNIHHRNETKRLTPGPSSLVVAPA